MRALPVIALLLCVVCLYGSRPAFAQPAADDCWLTVTVLSADGKPFSAAPAVALYRIVGTTRTYAGRQLLSTGNSTTMIGLTPGSHEVRLTLPTHALTDRPRTIELLPGANLLEWTLPPVVSVGGPLTLLTGMTQAKTAQGMLINVGKSGALPVTVALKDGGYLLPGVFPGPYRLFLQTERGYGLAQFSAAETATADVNAPVTLTAGATIGFQVSQQGTNNAATPLPNATVTVSGTVDKGFAISITLHTDAKGQAATLALPPGSWRWSAYFAGLQQATGTVTLTDAAQIVPVVLSPPPPPKT